MVALYFVCMFSYLNHFQIIIFNCWLIVDQFQHAEVSHIFLPPKSAIWKLELLIILLTMLGLSLHFWSGKLNNTSAEQYKSTTNSHQCMNVGMSCILYKPFLNFLRCDKNAENVALYGTATSSPVGYSGVPTRLIDGNANSSWAGGMNIITWSS